MPNMRPNGIPVDVSILTGFWTMQCETTWWAFARIHGKALTNVILYLLFWEWEDIVRGFIRPHRRRRRRRGRKRPRWRGIPEIGENFGGNLRDRLPLPPPVWDEGGKILWRIDGAFQKAGLIWMLHSVVEDYWEEVQLGMITTPDADCGNMPRMKRNQENVFHTPPIGWSATNMPDLDYAVDMIQDGFGVQVPAGQYMAILSLTVRANGHSGTFPRVNCALSADQLGVELWEEAGEKVITEGQTADFIAQISMIGPGFIQWHYFSLFAESKTEKGQILVWKVGDAQI